MSADRHVAVELHVLDRERAELRARLAAVDQRRRQLLPECTGVAAVWCPVHVDCTCLPPCPMCGTTDRVRGVGDRYRCEDCDTTYEEGVRDYLNDRACPLHGPASEHAERRGDASGS